jgi:hypothetical protein
VGFVFPLQACLNSIREGLRKDKMAALDPVGVSVSPDHTSGE